MKKLSVLVLVLAMLVCAFTACGGEVEQEVSTLNTAIKYVQAMYKEDDGLATPEDYTLVGVVNIDGTVFDVNWTSDKEEVKIVRAEDGKTVTVDVNEESPAEVAYTLTATIKDAEGKEVTCSFKHSVPEFKILSIPEVIALEDGTPVVLKGTVTAIDTAWSDQYKNISVYVEDEEGNKLLLYRLSTNVVVGDVITVKGTVGSYNGAKQIAQGATAEITDHIEIEVAYPEVTLAEAIASEDGTNVTVAGVVVSIDTEWSDQYGNISVTITDGKDNLYLYRLGTKVELGDVITVQGAVGSYKGTKQMAQGATAEIAGNHAEMTAAEATAAEDGTLVKVTGSVTSIDTEWSDQYNNITVTITDADGNTLYLYRLGTKVEVGDMITVYGKVGSYKGAKQIAAGAFALIADEK